MFSPARLTTASHSGKGEFEISFCLLERKQTLSNCFSHIKLLPGGGGGYAVNFWVGMCRWDSETLTLY